MMVVRAHARSTSRSAITIILLILAGAALASGYILPVLGATLAFTAVALSRGRVIDLLVSIGVLTIGFSGINVGPITAPDIFLLPAALLLGLRYVLSMHEHTPSWLLGSACTILGAGLIAHGVFPDLPSRSLIILFQLCLSLLYVPLVLSLSIHREAQLSRFSALYVASASICAVFAFLELIGLTDIASRLSGFQGFAQNGGRPASFTAHPNQLGLFSVLAFPFAVDLYRRNRFWCISLVLLALGVMASGSRTALIGLVVAAAASLWTNSSISTTRLVKGGIGLAFVGALVVAGGADSALERVLGNDRTVIEATEARNESVEVAVQDIQRHPLTGVGFGKNAHSLYLQILQGAGIVAFAGFLWFAQRGLRAARSVRHIPVARAAEAALITWLVTGLVHPGLYDRYLYVPVGVILGARVLAARKERSSPAARSLGAGAPQANEASTTERYEELSSPVSASQQPRLAAISNQREPGLQPRGNTAQSRFPHPSGDS